MYNIADKTDGVDNLEDYEFNSLKNELLNIINDDGQTPDVAAVRQISDAIFSKVIQDYTVVGSVGSALQQFAGRDYTISELVTKFGLGAVDAFYTFPATDLLNDQSANAYNLTGVNVTDADNTTGIMNTNYAVSLDGSTETMYQATLWDTMPTSLAISFWINLTNTPGTNATIIYKEGTASNHKFSIGFNTTYNLVFSVTIGVATYSCVSIADSVRFLGKWTHVVVCHDITNGMRLFIDGKLEDQNALATTLPTGGTTTDIYIGSNATPGNYCAGKISNVIFLDKELSEEDIDWLYATAVDLPTLLQSRSFIGGAFCKDASNNIREAYFAEVVRETTRILLYGGCRIPTDSYRLVGRV